MTDDIRPGASVKWRTARGYRATGVVISVDGPNARINPSGHLESVSSHVRVTVPVAKLSLAATTYRAAS